MKRQRKSRSRFAFVVFATLILFSGYALNAAGYADSPFDEIAFLSSWVTGGEERFSGDFDATTNISGLSIAASGADANGIDLTGLGADDRQFHLPSLDAEEDASEETQFTLPPLDQLNDASTNNSGDFSGAQFDEQEDIGYPADLSDIGSVLYDFWFICATTAVFIVVQWLFKFGKKQFKRRLPVVAAAK